MTAAKHRRVYDVGGKPAADPYDVGSGRLQ